MPLVTVPLAEIIPSTPRSRLLRIDIRHAAFQFQAGQAVMLGQHGSSERRPYSIACSPQQAAETDQLEILVATERDGSLGAHLASAVPGAALDVEGPLGSFTLPGFESPSRALLVAGGTGIAPLRSMLDHILRRQPPIRVSLLYSARGSDEFAFIEEFQRHADTGRLELHQTVTRDRGTSWSGQRGRIGRSHFEAVLHDATNTYCFVCGPDLLVAESVSTLKELGVPDAMLRTERWTK